MLPETLQTIAPFVSSGFAMLMLILSIRKMGEEVYIPRTAPLIVISITALATFAYVTLTRTQINWMVAALLIVVGSLIGGVEGQMTRLYYRGPIIVGKRSVGYLIFWGLAYALTAALTATGQGALHAAGVMTLMFGLGIAVGDNTTLIFRQLFLKRPPVPEATAIKIDTSVERFGNVEAEYFRWRGRMAAGQITRAQLEAMLKEMMLQDALGRWWTIGVDSGKWYVRQGETWMESHPPIPETGMTPQVIVVQGPAQTPTPPALTQSSGCSSCGCLLMGVLVLVLLLTLALVVGYGLIHTVS